jgi:hypothetical protein
MIAQGAMAFNSRRSPTTCPYSVPQILVTLKAFDKRASTGLALMMLFAVMNVTIFLILG